MRITKTHFNRFKREFDRYIDKLGLNGYRITYRHEPINGAYASIHVSEPAKLAVVTLCTEIDKSDVGEYCTPESHARHEAMHLFLSKISWLAESRYTTENEINEENERLVRVLEKQMKCEG